MSLLLTKYKLIKQTFYQSHLFHAMFTWILWKIYYKLVIGLIIALSINSCYHSNGRECNAMEGLTNRIK